MSGSTSQKRRVTFDVKNDGVVLSATFDRSAATFADDLRAFGKKLEELQAKLGFSTFVRGVREDGTRLIVKIIPARPGERATGLESLMDDLERGAGAFDGARGPSRAPLIDVNAALPAPSDDPQLNDDLKKALLIPRR